MPAVFRAVLPKARDFLSFWERVGRPRYAVREDAGHVSTVTAADGFCRRDGQAA